MSARELLAKRAWWRRFWMKLQQINPRDSAYEHLFRCYAPRPRELGRPAWGRGHLEARTARPYR